MIESTDCPLHRVWLVMLYATGLRREELVQLKVSDIDSARMLIHVHQCKGNQDRDVMLSPKLLEELRQYWRQTNFKPKTYLFPGGGRAHATDVPMSAKSVFHAVKHAAQRAGLKKHVHPAHSSPLLRYPSTRSRCRFAHHSTFARPRRSENN